ncbi:MAG: MCE family protein [Deltaproteobacteria bacterium]|nr:MCE family protein [Deltaproteobacteria bacterium]
MSLTYQHSRFRYANQAVGVFVILTVIIFGAAFLFSGQVREWLEPGERIKVILPSDGLFGLSEGAEVEVLGTRAGKVLRIVINPDRKMHADVQIQSDMKPFVRRDSSAVIRKRFGVAGDSFLDISRGFGQPLDWEFAVINATADRAPTESIGEILDQVRTKVFPVIDDTRQAMRLILAVVEDLQDPSGDMQQLLTNLNAVSGKIARGEGVIGRLLAEEKMMDDFVALVAGLNESMARFDPLFEDLTTTIGNVAEISAQINEQSKGLPEITLKLKELLVSVQAVMKDMSRTTPQLPRIAENVAQATDSVPVLLLQTQQVMAELELLIRQLQSHWLLGGGAAKAQPASTRISPLEVDP